MKTKPIDNKRLEVLGLIICSRKLPLAIIERSDEEFVRKAEKLLNEMINQMRDKCQGDKEVDEKDYLLMVAMEVLARWLKSYNYMESYDKKIQAMIDDLDNYLQI